MIILLMSAALPAASCGMRPSIIREALCTNF